VVPVLGVFKERFPANSLNPTEKLLAEFETINGDSFTSDNFTLTISVFERNQNKVFYIQLPYILSEEERRDSDHRLNYLYYEFGENIDIPANVLNKTESTKGSQSSSWDETKIVLEDFELTIQDEKDHTVIRSKGSFDTQKVVASTNFYIGFSCGVMPQPYVMSESIGSITITKINSINNRNLIKRSSNPIPSNIANNGKACGDHSFNLFINIYELVTNEPGRFASIFGQWERVWYGFTSVDEISELVLSVSIEGLLNDVYIPIFKKTRVDTKLLEEITDIKRKLSDLDIPKNHLERLKSSASYWKNITAAKALDLLINDEIIDAGNKKVWQSLRNSSAHPKIKELNSAEEQKKLDDLLDCLNLFHKLVLNIIGYSGPINDFNSNEGKRALMIQHKEVLDTKI